MTGGENLGFTSDAADTAETIETVDVLTSAVKAENNGTKVEEIADEAAPFANFTATENSAAAVIFKGTWGLMNLIALVIMAIMLIPCGRNCKSKKKQVNPLSYPKQGRSVLYLDKAGTVPTFYEWPPEGDPSLLLRMTGTCLHLLLKFAVNKVKI